MTPRHLAIPLLCASALLILGAGCPRYYEPPEDVEVPEALGREMTEREADRIVRVIERRCVVCHACYDAPCQLNLTSREGLQRGANKDTVYRSSRLRAAKPTRLGIDASGPDGWRELDFFSVTEVDENKGANLILSMLALGRSHTFEPNEPLPEEVSLALDRSLSCPRADEMGRYAKDHPKGGMPYGMAPLTDAEYEDIGSWAAADAPVRARPALDPVLVSQIADWETALNGRELRNRVVARYLFEHWVFADLYFSSDPTGGFFEIVRSRTPPGTPIDVIATRYPYDDPGVKQFWYRLREVSTIIAYKAHITYEIGPERLARYKELFLADDWTATRYPSWDIEEASNPFIAFEEIPAGARYQFLLDDAQYFIRTFIRGPVCRGQAATDVIQDRFFVSFLDPDEDISVQDPTFLPELKDYLLLPAEAGSNMSLFDIWSKYDAAQTTYRDKRAAAYTERFAGRGATLDLIWDGDGTNHDAMLTVFRNEDNATVVQGWVGATPKTAWVIDYPVFERIYYNLVAGYDVFGNVAHQLAVRIYMDNLRMESEANFLTLLPEGDREKIWASWYEGATEKKKFTTVNRLRGKGFPSDIVFKTDDPKAELLDMMLARNAAVAGLPDKLNRCLARPCDRAGATPLEKTAEAEFRRMTGQQGAFASPLPEVSLVRVLGKGTRDSRAYTLMHDHAHSNVAAIFGEENRFVPEDDRITVVRGLVGSYPNFSFDVPVDEVPEFVDALLGIAKPEDLTAIVVRWGIRRSSPAFWGTIDWFQDRLLEQSRLEAGTLDLSRYKNL